MNQDAEIAHLVELMPASGRMYCKLVSRPEQSQVIVANLPPPWSQSRPISINFDLWAELTRPQRDLLLLRTVSWLTTARWLKFDLSRGVLAAGLVGTLVELVQGDVIGVMTGTSLMGWAGWRVWQENRSSQQEIAADEVAVGFAQRRGYGEQDAARHLLSAIEEVAKIENRFGLDFVELLRCQNLRAIAGLSSVSIPPDFRKPSQP